ncbi:ABC transporter ATP-binding protein [Mycoplasmopsis fermentans]|uniref:ABC transporter related protein n=1 Tax=Mycoplasmopsis fermentans (strain M64) TaxID=943945 RepID=A0AB32XD15_MYCFM|nr:ABC transporter ATP-binding protein [Mycoplasmopsis fermentans]ADV34965.1 ABC transporter related protein [Mycoplasmopsis fermentans M64]
MSEIIKVENLKKSYGKVEAVKGISFIVKEGELFAFLGPNGAGKSTTIDTLCTLNDYNEGQITICGFDLKKQSDEIKKQIGVVFQDSVLDRKLSVRDNLTIRVAYYYRKKADIKAAFERVVKDTQIEDILKRKYEKLSGGQRRRVDIARALLNYPKILFLDEPTTGLDPQTRKLIWELIYELKNKNKTTIFLTTHYMEEAEKADYVVIMDNGKIVAKNTPAKLKEEYTKDRLKVYLENDVKYFKTVELLKNKGLKFKEFKDYIDIYLDSSFKAIDLANQLKDLISSFEVLKGDMDDVFINITGKEIR